MAGSLGSLVVSLGLDAAEFVSGLTKAEYLSKQAMDNIEKGVNAAAKSFLAIGLAAGAASVALINAAADLDDMAERTGASVEELSKLEQQARVSGTAIEVVESAIIKLTKGLNESDEGALKTQRAMAALGLSVEELRAADPAVAFKTVAKALDQYEDSGAKTALAMDAMGKSAAGVLPFMKDLARDAELTANVTAEQAAQAEELGKMWRRLENDVRNIGMAFALDLLPFLRDTITAFGGMGTAAGQVNTEFNPFKETLRAMAILGLNVSYVFATVAKDIAGVGAVLTLFSQGQFTAGRELGRQLVEDAKLARVEFDKMEQILLNAGNAPAAGSPSARTVADVDDERPNPSRRKLVYGDLAAQKSVAAERIKLREATAKVELEVIKDLGKAEVAALDFARQQNLVGERDYWKSKLDIAKRTLDAELQIIDTQRNSQSDSLSKTKKGTKEYYDAQGKLLQTDAERNKLIREFGQLGEDSYRQAQVALEQYRRSIEDVNTRILEMTGKTVEAEKARTIAQTDGLRKQALINGDQSAVDAIDRLRELSTAQAQFNDQKTKEGEVIARLGIEEERIQNSQRTGAIGEMESLNRTSAARTRAVQQLEAIVSAQERVAKASANPALLLQAEQARAALERLRTETNLLADKFDTIFKDSFSSAFSDFITGTKTAKEAFNDFAKSVTRSISDMVAQDFAKAIFGGGSGGGGSGGGGGAAGIGGFLAKIFGGGGGAAAGGGGAAAAAGPSEIDALIAWGASLATFAVGTPFVPEDMLAFVHKGERIVPANQNRQYGNGGMSIQMNVNTPDAGSFRASRGQITAQMASTIQAARRNM